MRRKFLIPLAFVCALVGCSVCLFFLLFNAPSAVNALSSLLEPIIGYRLQVDGTALSLDLHGEIRNLTITKQGETLPLASFAHAEFKANPPRPGTALVEKIVLDNPKFRFVLKPEKKEADWAGLNKLPPVKLLQIREGEIDISGPTYRVLATRLNVKVDDFSPRSGGKAHVISDIAFTTNNGINGNGGILADMRVKSLSPYLMGNGVISLNVKAAGSPGTLFKDVVLNASLSLNKEKLVFDPTTIRIGSLDRQSGKDHYHMGKSSLNGSGSYDWHSSVLSIKEVTGSVADTGEFSGTGETTLSGSFPFTANFSARSIDFARVFALVSPLLPADYRKWDIQGKGGLEADLEGLFSSQADIKGALKLRMRDAGFTSVDKSKAAAGLTGEVTLKLQPQRSKKGNFSSSIELRGGELLWGGYYKDFAGETLAVSSQGQFTVRDAPSLDCAGDLDAFQTGNYGFSASLTKDSMSLSLTAHSLSHDRLYGLLAKDYLGEDSVFSGLRLSGRSDVNISLVQSEGKTAISGRMRVADTSLTVPKLHVALDTLNITLPFDLSYPPSDGQNNGMHEPGLIRLKRFDRGNIRLENMEIPLVLTHNRLQTLKPIEAQLFGGTLRLHPVRAQNLLTPSVEVLTGFTAQNVDLARMTEEFLGTAVQGTVSADLGDVSFRQGKWLSSGAVQAIMFGGEVDVKHLAASDLLSPSRTIGGDIAFQNIDLEQVTNLIETGKVTGIVKGSITDFTMSYGQPASFVLTLQSDPSKSARRMISVDAIKNLSIIGTGSSGISAVMNSGINRFFRAYPYSRIGILCTLKNDTFRLRGTIRDGNTEYLIRRGLFRGIDVINQNPDNAISFRDMQERIGRIFEHENMKTDIL